MFLQGLALIGGGGFLASLVYVIRVASSDTKKIKQKFNCPIAITVGIKDYVVRSDTEAFLKMILTPKEVENYWIISGEHGTGKTTTVQKVCQDIGKGIIYVDVPENVADFKNSLANALGLTHRHNSGFWHFIHQNVYGREPLSGNYVSYYQISPGNMH